MSETYKDELKIIDKYGFLHTINIKHHPELGTSIAYYNYQRIDQFEYGRWLLPQTDDDGEWEQFEEKFRESIGSEALVQFEYSCKKYIDKNLNK